MAGADLDVKQFAQFLSEDAFALPPEHWTLIMSCARARSSTSSDVAQIRVTREAWKPFAGAAPSIFGATRTSIF
jgi:hypothetical protein